MVRLKVVRSGSWWFVVVRGGLMSMVRGRFVVVRGGIRGGSWWFFSKSAPVTLEENLSC